MGEGFQVKSDPVLWEKLGMDVQRFSGMPAMLTQAYTNFAESEVISLKNRGVCPAAIARSVHLAVANRLATMLRKVGYDDHVVFTGGVANNAPVCVPSVPSIVGALGAAIHGSSIAQGSAA